MTAIPDCAKNLRTGLADAVLAEIAGHLARLAADSAHDAAIDLRSLPMTAFDRAELFDALGEGEVSASLELAGRTEISETAFAGVWRVTHAGADGNPAVEQIVIARIPDILLAHPADIAAAAARLSAGQAAIAVSTASTESHHA